MKEVLAVGGLVTLCAIASLFITDAVYKYATHRSILDVPNHRSLHSVPTPRGGGLGICVVAFFAVIAAMAAGLLSPRVGAALLGGIPIALIGWIDDKRGANAGVRLLVHTAAAVWAVWILGGLPAIDLGVARVSWGPAGGAVAVLLIVWLTNLYNFMDGIDGIAGTEAAVVAGAGGILLLATDQTGLGVVSLAICGASLGFLIRNWAPARIFMGDVASGLLGFLFGVIGVASERSGGIPLVAWLILLALFVADATFTLIRRIARGETWYAAHRAHAYQRLVQAGWTHARVSLFVAFLNVVLAALVVAAIARHELLLPLLLVTAAALGVLYLVVERFAPLHEAHAGGARAAR